MRPWEYYNSNKNDFGLQYQVVVSLGMPFRILHFDGPYKGAAADVSILRTTILKSLKQNEKVMTDKAYRFEKKCWTPPPGKYGSLSEIQKRDRREVTRIRQLNERVIKAQK